jgi:hypothetical protein
MTMKKGSKCSQQRTDRTALGRAGVHRNGKSRMFADRRARALALVAAAALIAVVIAASAKVHAQAMSGTMTVPGTAA